MVRQIAENRLMRSHDSPLCRSIKFGNECSNRNLLRPIAEEVFMLSYAEFHLFILYGSIIVSQQTMLF